MDVGITCWVLLALIFQLGSCHEAREDESLMKLSYNEEDTPLTCDTTELAVGEVGGIIQCFPDQGPSGFVTKDTVCAVSLDIRNSNEMALKKCVNGKWTDTSLGSSGGTEVRYVDNTKYAPKFDTPCTPSDLKETYFVESGQTETKVNWSEPLATDSDGIIESVSQMNGEPSGSKFEGDTTGKTHYITYVAKDNDGQEDSCYFRFKVKIQNCTIAAWPSNGRRDCSLHNYLGSVCTYTCNTGYEVSGSSQITCQGSPSPTWSSFPTCQKKICPSPPSPENGIVSCKESTYEYQLTCQISCNSGYGLIGIDVAYTTCQADETWSNLENAVCTDNEPPELSCKTPQIFYADKSSTSVSVEWTLPTATDSLDPNPTLHQTSGQPRGSEFHVGSSFVTYTAKDNLNNESPECSIEIRVEETACQHPTDTFEDTNMMYSCSGSTYTYGIECSLSCSNNLPLIGSELVVCERNDSPNSSGLAVGVWSWESDEKPFCNHTDCPALDPPLNGALVPNFVGAIRIYTMLCNNESDIPIVNTLFTGMFICQNDGTYTPPIDVPDCTERRSPFGMLLPSDIYYYSGDCSDPATQEIIKNQGREILNTTMNSLFRAICPTTNKCTVISLNVICGPTSRRRRRVSTTSKSKSIGQAFFYPRMQKRRSPTMVVEFDIRIAVNHDADLVSDLDYMHAILFNDLKPKLQELVDNGTLDHGDFYTDDSSFRTDDDVYLECPVGHLLQQLTCVPCPSGYYLNSSSICELCPLGYYSDEPALTSCKACPIGYSTLATGSKNEDKCLEICPAGKYSATGLVPCTVCPIGYYQSGTRQTNCTQCPTGTTEFAGSVSSTTCQAFHLLIENTVEDVTGTTISADLMDLTLMLWVKLFANLSANAQIKLKSGEDDLIILNFTDKIRINLPSSSFNKVVSSLTSSKWYHVTVTWDTANTELSVYINGQLEVSDNTLTPSSSPLITDGSVLLQSSGDTGVFIADIHLVDAVIPLSAIIQITNSCWTERTDDVVGMSDFRSKTLPGVQLQTPLSCDPIDECATNPCNNHTCINGINTYTCYCSFGWSGANCDTPPDYCIDNGCTNGATCVSGQSGYKCTCPLGYSGYMCEEAPVNGGWSEWTAWERCTVSCNGGTESRSRSCDNPEPSPHGSGCSGDSNEAQTCNQDPCPTCPGLRGFATFTNCTEEQATRIETCRIYCRAGYVFPSSMDNVEYTCGFSTNFTWLPNSNPPHCEEPNSPNRYEVTVNTETNITITDDVKSEVQQSITDKLTELKCVQDNVCEAFVAISNYPVSTISLSLIVEMTETGALDIQSYIDTSTISPPLQEVIDVINSLEITASYINTSSSSIFDVTVNGVTYTSSQSTLTINGNITCPTGQTVTEGVCVSCPEGTYYIGGYCSYCNKGTYSSSLGQTSCTTCPDGLSTITIGSYAASQCTESVHVTTSTTTSTTTDSSESNNPSSESVNVTTSTSTTTESSESNNPSLESVDVTTTTASTATESSEANNSSSDNTAVYAGIAIGAVGLALLGVCAFVIYKKKPNMIWRLVSKRYSHSQARPHNESKQNSVRSVRYGVYPKIPVFENPTYHEEAEHDILKDIRPSFPPQLASDEYTSLPYNN